MAPRKVGLRIACLLCLFVVVGRNVWAQDGAVKFALVRLSDHTPVANQHLLVFAGVTVRQARKHTIRINVETDAKGITSLVLDARLVWFQVWIDGPKTCPGSIPARDVFHRGVLMDEGALLSNTCGQGLERLQPYFEMSPPTVVHVPAHQ